MQLIEVLIIKERKRLDPDLPKCVQNNFCSDIILTGYLIIYPTRYKPLILRYTVSRISSCQKGQISGRTVHALLIVYCAGVATGWRVP